MKGEFWQLGMATAVAGVVLWEGDAAPFPLDPRLRSLVACCAAAWVALRLLAFLKAWRRTRRWRVSPSWVFAARDLPFESARRWLPRLLAKPLWRCVPRAHLFYRDDGILLGRAFQWTPRHTQELENFMHEGARPLPTARDQRGGHPALHAVGRGRERPLVLPWSDLVGHVLIGGTTRSGKTRLLEVILAEAIRGAGTVIVIDPKGDADLLARAATESFDQGRDFAFFSPAFPEQSKSFNPLGMCETPSELAARIQALMPGGGAMSGDPFFTEYPLAVAERLATAQEAVGERWSIERLNAVATLVPPLESLIARYLHGVVLKLGGPMPALADLIEAYGKSQQRDLLADALIDDYNKPRDHFLKVTANLVPAFRGVTGGDMTRLLSSEQPVLTWDRIIEKRTVVYFSMNSLMFGEVSNRIGRVVLQDLIGFLGRRYAYQDPAGMSPLFILIDEFSNVAYPGFVDALNKGGGAAANFVLAMQSLADPEATMGRDGTQRILDNLNTRIWCRLADDETAKLATESLGMMNVSREDISYHLSFGGDKEIGGATRGVLQYTEKPLFRSEWLTAMPRGEALVRLRGENWKLRVPLLAPVSKRQLREVAKAYGLDEVLMVLPGKAAKPKSQQAPTVPPAAAENPDRVVTTEDVSELEEAMSETLS